MFLTSLLGIIERVTGDIDTVHISFQKEFFNIEKYKIKAMDNKDLRSRKVINIKHMNNPNRYRM